MAILSFQGFRRAITVSKRSGFVTKGHGLLLACLQAGWNKVPVDYQDYSDESQELADIVADNQLGRMSEMDNRQLQEILVKLDSGAFNMELTGFDGVKLEKLFTGFGAKPNEPVFSGGEGAPGDASPSAGDPSLPNAVAPAPSHVRMVQLFLNDETQAELMTMCDYFQRVLGSDNVTDTVLEVMRSAYRAHCADNPQAAAPEVAVPQEPVA